MRQRLVDFTNLTTIPRHPYPIKFRRDRKLLAEAGHPDCAIPYFDHAVLIGAWSSAHAQQAPNTVIAISQCGTIISQPGMYTLTQSLQNTSLTVDCIRITSPAVGLDLAEFNLSRPSGSNITAAGLRVLDTANGVQISGAGSTIQGFAVGMAIAGAGVSILGDTQGFVITANVLQGVLLSHANNVLIEALSSSGNGRSGLEVAQSTGVIVQSQTILQGNSGYGLWVHSSSNNQFFLPFAFQNKLPCWYSLNTLSGSAQKGPWASLAIDTDGNLYGSTAGDGANGYGSIFKLTASGGNWTYSSLHDFTRGTDGLFPRCSPVLDSSANVYGTASEGGVSDCCGVAFKITP